MEEGYIGKDMKPPAARKMSRRSLLKTGGKVAGGLLVAAVVGTEGLRIAGKVAGELEPSYDPNEVYVGTVQVSKGVNVRTSPNIPSQGLGPNTIDWGKIEEINGVSLNDANDFSIDNPLVYMGFNPNGNDEKSPWIKMNARISNSLTGIFYHDIFVNIGGQTSEFIQRQGDGSFLKAEKNNDGKLTATGSGLTLKPEQIGVVKVNPKQ